MFDSINKSKISFEDYVKLKTESLTKSYTERFKKIHDILYGFSWFGNGVSIFLAFFFIQSLFLSSFVAASSSIFVTIGIIVFLSMFELLKRYTFGLFSSGFIKSQYNIFKKKMFGFLFGVLIIITGSFYFSLNGAMELVDNRQIFTEQTEMNISERVDSINDHYNTNYINPLLQENRVLLEQNSQYAQQAAETSFITRYTGLIDNNNEKIGTNRELIERYENRRDNEIIEIRETQTERLSETLSISKSNILIFILISSMIETIIMIGVYYTKYFNKKKLDEYEETIVATPEFKTWYKFNSLLEMIYNKVKDVGEKIPSTNALLNLAEISNNEVDKRTMDKFIKTMYYLDIVSLKGNRRILNMSKEEGLNTLREYFEIK